VVTEPDLLDPARAVLETELDAVGRAASRFRPDSEIVAVNRSAGRPIELSPLLTDLVRTALDAARRSEGTVDPTVGAGLRGVGYTADIGELARHEPSGAEQRQVVAGGFRVVIDRHRSWRDVVLDGALLSMPRGVELDLGATAKARTADRAAARIAAELGCGVLVGVGGDIATAGTGPEGGWQIRVGDGPGEPEAQVTLPAGRAIATSSTVRRAWHHDGALMHHILDPATWHPAAPVWRTITAVAPSCVTANTWTTAGVVMGLRAPEWLAAQGVCARLVGNDFTVVRLGGWP